MRKPFGTIARFVLYRGVVFDDARDHLEVSDATGKGVGGGLEDKSRAVSGIGNLLRCFLTVDQSWNGLAIDRGRQEVYDQIENRRRPDVVQSRSARHRVNASILHC